MICERNVYLVPPARCMWTGNTFMYMKQKTFVTVLRTAGSTVQNRVARATRSSGFVQPVYPSPVIIITLTNIKASYNLLVTNFLEQQTMHEKCLNEAKYFVAIRIIDVKTVMTSKYCCCCWCIAVHTDALSRKSNEMLFKFKTSLRKCLKTPDGKSCAWRDTDSKAISQYAF